MANRLKKTSDAKVIKFTLFNDSKDGVTKSANLSPDTNKYTFIGSKEIVDRDGDIVRVAGINTTTYKTNPVVMAIHKTYELPVGKTVGIRKTTDTMYMDVEFAGTPDGAEVKQLVDERMLNAVSISFMAKSRDSVYWSPTYLELLSSYGLNTEGMKTYGDLEVDDPNYYKANVKMLKKADRLFYATELLELSVVPIPANQDALYVASSKGLNNVIMKSFDNEYIKMELPEVKAAIPYSVQPKDTVLDATSAWSAPSAITELRKWSSSDGSGDKNTIKWSKYKAGFTWLNSKAVTAFGSYKLPHHTVDSNKFTTVLRGVYAAMGSLLGSRGGVNLPEEDRKPVYNHLKKHYKEFDKTAPEFKDYSFAEAVETLDELTLKGFISEFSIDSLKAEIKSNKEVIDDLNKQLSTAVDLNKKSIKEIPIKSDPPSVKGAEKGNDKVDDLLLDRTFIKNYVKKLTINTLKGV